MKRNQTECYWWRNLKKHERNCKGLNCDCSKDPLFNYIQILPCIWVFRRQLPSIQFPPKSQFFTTISSQFLNFIPEFFSIRAQFLSSSSPVIAKSLALQCLPVFIQDAFHNAYVSKNEPKGLNRIRLKGDQWKSSKLTKNRLHASLRPKGNDLYCVVRGEILGPIALVSQKANDSPSHFSGKYSFKGDTWRNLWNGTIRRLLKLV